MKGTSVMALITPRKYVTRKMLAEVEEIVCRTNEMHSVQISPAMSIDFGTFGLTLNKLYDHHIYHKHVNGWREKTANEINAEFYEQEWTR